MKSREMTPRSVSFAYLFGPPRHIARDEAARIHAVVCDRLGLDDISFVYKSEPGTDDEPGGFGMAFRRTEGKEQFQMTIESQGLRAPMRMLLTTAWPESLKAVETCFDAAAAAAFEALGEGWQKVLVETRLRAHCAAGSGSGSEYLRSELLRFAPAWSDSEAGARASYSVCYKLASSCPEEDPARELQVEPLQADPQSVYLELISRWSIGAREKGKDIVGIQGAPTEYLRDSYDCLVEQALPVESSGGEKTMTSSRSRKTRRSRTHSQQGAKS